MLISAIVPVYNVEAYLDRCVSSICRQTFGDLEVILVDDGSRDGSGAICDAWAARDPRVRVIHKANGGVSSARNVGIAAAEGEYICFVDSDDWLETDYFEAAAEILTRERPQLLANNYVEDDGGGCVTCKFPPSADLHMGAVEAFHAMVTGSHLGWEPFASFYEANGCKKIQFPADIIYGEDLHFRYHFTRENPGLYIYHRLPKYHYFMRADSAVHSYSLHKKADDLKVLDMVMAGAEPQTASLVLGKEYALRLSQRYVQGMKSRDPQERAAAKDCKRRIAARFLDFMKCPHVSWKMKAKLTVCLLPWPLVRLVDGVYRRGKGAE